MDLLPELLKKDPCHFTRRKYSDVVRKIYDRFVADFVRLIGTKII